MSGTASLRPLARGGEPRGPAPHHLGGAGPRAPGKKFRMWGSLGLALRHVSTLGLRLRDVAFR